ncbi:MAG: BREX system P-loop protein BrxC [Chloroflexi bacterium]|nr:BREX system P-loop protein BrxC [Chloroflexota bacterium]
MTLNRNVFLNDPTKASIPNEGFAQVGAPETEQQWEVLKYELRSFVCEGEYLRGMERVLHSYLDHLNQPKQPAIWVSGFYGSGKTHFVRVFEWLWRDVELPGGVRARSLPQQLPESIKDLLHELSTAGKREGGLWSTAGTLNSSVVKTSSGLNVRPAILAVIFRGAGLPSRYFQARFVLWLKQEGFFDSVMAAIEARGRTLESELPHLYVSDVLAESLLVANPNLANSPKEVRQIIRTQFPMVDDISDDETIEAIDQVLRLHSDKPGKIPCTLLVLDELQQFIGDDSNRTIHVQNVVEAISSRFGSQFLFVATGQSDIATTAQLQKLQGRFTVRVQLADTDVDRVVREVVLRKNPVHVAELSQVLDHASGEVSRHLNGARIGPTALDQRDLVPDYPLLPTRRRFWERVLRAIDTAGTAGQLRTQLKIIHEAARALANEPLGTVVPGDFIYEQQRPGMLASGVLQRELAQLIEEQRDDTPDGELRARLCATIFLIGKLPDDGPAATGVRATTDMLADLLVSDLPSGSATLRQRIPQLLQDLVDRSVLILADGEYRLQTRESKEWDSDYRGRYARILSDDSRIVGDRSDALRAAIDEALKGISPVQGQSKTPRKVELSFASSAPPTDTPNIPVWVRDEWLVTERTVREDAQAAGQESPTVFVFLPRRDAEALKTALARFAAATETLETRAMPSTEEGKDARSGMVSRRDTEQEALRSLIADIVASARVFKGGGGEVSEGSLRDSVAKAVEGAMVRLFPKFAMADHSNWGQVFTRASQGSADPLGALSYNGDVDKHPACQDIRAFVGANGRRGSEIQKRFLGAGYGWPKDAVDGALLALVAGGFLRASRGGQPQKVTEIGRAQIGQTDFFSEGVTVTTTQRVGIRGLCQQVGLPCKAGEEALAAPELLKRLVALAAEAGGLPPLPAPPHNDHLMHLLSLGGNEQLVQVYNQRDQLLADYRQWSEAHSRREQRFPAWRHIQDLLRHADGLSVVAELQPQLAAIEAQRALLSDPDPLAPLTARLLDELRAALQRSAQRYGDAHRQALAELEQATDWARINAEQRRQILAAQNLDQSPAARFGSDAELVATLEATPLLAWETRIAALPERVARAREAAARLLEPRAVPLTLPKRTLKSHEELEQYLDEVRALIQAHLDEGNPVIV